MKKIVLILSTVLVITCLFAISVSAAEPSYADGEWIYAADGTTKLAIRDTDGNPLLWYMNGEELKYVRADQTDKTQSVYVEYGISAGGSGFDTKVFSPQKTLKSIKVFDNGTEIMGYGDKLDLQKIVLMNLEWMDIDAFNGWLFGNKRGCCPMLRGIVLPSTLEGIGQEGFTNTKLVQIWNLENTQLFYLNSSDFASTTTLTQEATNGVIKTPVTLMRPLNIQYSQVTTYIMNPYYDYPQLNQLWHQILRGCSKLQAIYCPAQVSGGFGSEAFRDTPAQYIMFLTGTKEDAENTIANTNSSHNSNFKNAKIISYDEYLADKATYDSATKQVYVVYGYDFCEAFFDGHKMSENTEMKLTSYFEPIKFASVCTRDGCDHAGYDESKTIGAIFASYGYSMTEVEIGGKLSMSQFFGIDKANLEKYTTLTGNAFEYGFVVSSNADPMNEANKTLIAEGKTYITTQNGFKHDYFAVAVAGFTDATVDNALTFCVYVKDGAKVSYLDNGETVETVNMKSYNQIKALLGK